MNRINKIKNNFKNSTADAILVSSEVNQRYISNLAFTDGYIFITKRNAYLITDFRYIEVAKSSCGNDFIVSMSI